MCERVCVVELVMHSFAFYELSVGFRPSVLDVKWVEKGNQTLWVSASRQESWSLFATYLNMFLKQSI